MSAPSHIPGPWSHSFESADPEWAVVTIKGGLVVANVNAHHRQEANARLIAAAPEMLEALEDAQAALSNAIHLHGKVAPWRFALDRVRAAIAKAEGQS